jgi:hypothetical protein
MRRTKFPPIAYAALNLTDSGYLSPPLFLVTVLLLLKER